MKGNYIRHADIIRKYSCHECYILAYILHVNVVHNRKVVKNEKLVRIHSCHHWVTLCRSFLEFAGIRPSNRGRICCRVSRFPLNIMKLHW